MANGIYGYCLIVKTAAIFEVVLLLEIISFGTYTCNVFPAAIFSDVFTGKYKRKELGF